MISKTSGWPKENHRPFSLPQSHPIHSGDLAAHPPDRSALAASSHSQGLAGGLGELRKLNASLRVPLAGRNKPRYLSCPSFPSILASLCLRKGLNLSTETFNFLFRSEAEVTPFA